MTFALGLALGLPLGVALTFAALCALNAWMASRDDDPRPGTSGQRGSPRRCTPPGVTNERMIP